MAGEATLALQQSVYQQLQATPAVTSLVTGIHDAVPKNAALPYISLGVGSVRDWSSKSFNGQEHRLLIHIWSDAPGHSQAKTIMAAVYESLLQASITVSGQQLVNLNFEFAEVFQDPMPQVTHCVMRFRAVTLAQP